LMASSTCRTQASAVSTEHPRPQWPAGAVSAPSVLMADRPTSRAVSATPPTPRGQPDVPSAPPQHQALIQARLQPDGEEGRVPLQRARGGRAHA
jgi:hypothetical protein